MSGWTAKEELLLLENLLRFRLGNWSSISEAMGRSKSAKECESHFKEVYFGKTVNHLKEYQIISFLDNSGMIQTRQVSNFELLNKVKSNEDYYAFDRRVDNDKGILGDFAGYMPLRKDFDIEFENDFENYLADLDFYDDDRPNDIAAKLKLLDSYQLVLNEREKRKNFVLDRWPLEIKLEKKAKNNVFEKIACNMMKPAARLLPFDKYKDFCDALSKEYMIKMLLDELKEARSKGIKNEDDFKRFLMNKKNNFPMKSKEYEILIREPFAYKKGEEIKAEILKKLEGFPGNAEEFGKKVAVNEGQVNILMDKIVSNLEGRAGIFNDVLIEESDKRELISFVVKMREN
jgi:transcriptional adapter 2-alpha